ncbi:MAG: hypothetical protein EPN22_10375 [Nitrospirae bacterium]|nr:MAG: hypothetical protein EPN22_10375 [Nitrospirota bacterium]
MEGDPGKTDSSLKKLASFSVLTMTVTLLRFGSRIIKNSVFTRLLGPAERGVFGLLTTIPDLIVCSGDLGLGMGTMYLAAKKKYDLGKLIGNTIMASVLLGAVMVAVGYVLLSYEGILKGDAATISALAPIVLFMVPFVLLQRFGEDLLLAVQEIKFLNTMKMVFSTFPILALIVLYLLTGKALQSAMYAWGSSVIIFGLGAVLRVSALCNYRLGLSFDYFKETLSYGIKIMGSTLAGVFVKRIDVLIVSSMLGAEPLGYYAISVSMAEIILAVPDAVNIPFLPIRLGLEKKEAKSVTPVVTRVLFFFMLLLCILSVLFSGLAVQILFGSKFLPAIPPLLWLLPGIVMWSIHEVLKSELYGHGHPGFVSFEAGMTLACNVGLNFMLIPVMGINGAALSSSIAYTLAAGILLWKFTSLSGVRLSEMLIIKKEDLQGIKRALFKKR